MESLLLPVAGIVAVVIAAIALTRLFAGKPDQASTAATPRPTHASAAPAQPRPAAATGAERSYPITTIGIPPGHVTPSSATPMASAAASRAYPITTIGIPPGHVTPA